MDTSAAFCLWHTLYTMYTTFILHTGICSLSCDHKYNFLESTDSVFIEGDHLCLPASAVCIMYIHTVDLSRKKGSFISTCTCTDLHDNVLVIVRVFWKKKNLELLFQLFDSLLRLTEFFFCQLFHLFIGFFLQKRKTVFNVLFTIFIFFICLNNRGQIILFFHQLAET